MAQIQLFFGEQDGTVLKIGTKTSRPEIFYAVSNDDESRIKNAADPKVKVQLRKQLSRLAYKFEKSVNRSGVGVEYQYVRCPSMDKVDPSQDAVDQH